MLHTHFYVSHFKNHLFSVFGSFFLFAPLTVTAQVSDGLDSTIVISEIKKDSRYFVKEMSPGDFAWKGEIDALNNYKKYKGAKTGTLITSLASPLLGLIPAIVYTAVKPKMENLDYPDQNLFDNADYRKSYIDKAQSIKSGKIWKNWGIGLGVNIAFAIVLTTRSR